MKKEIFILIMAISLLLSFSAVAAVIPNYNGTAGQTTVNGTSAAPELQFTQKTFAGGQFLPVYSGPGYEYYRSANGRASVSTNDSIYMAGRIGDWAMILYQKTGGFRVGWIDASKLQYNLGGQKITLARIAAVANQNCSMTDDPKQQSAVICELMEGDPLTYLASYYDHRQWAYVEVFAQQPVCGFIPMEYLDLN